MSRYRELQARLDACEERTTALMDHIDRIRHALETRFQGRMRVLEGEYVGLLEQLKVAQRSLNQEIDAMAAGNWVDWSRAPTQEDLEEHLRDLVDRYGPLPPEKLRVMERERIRGVIARARAGRTSEGPD